MKMAMPFRLFKFAIRSGNFDLRTASLIRLVPVVLSFGGPKYQQLIMQHVYDLRSCSAAKLERLRSSFVISLGGTNRGIPQFTSSFMTPVSFG